MHTGAGRGGDAGPEDKQTKGDKKKEKGMRDKYATARVRVCACLHFRFFSGRLATLLLASRRLSSLSHNGASTFEEMDAYAHKEAPISKCRPPPPHPSLRPFKAHEQTEEGPFVRTGFPSHGARAEKRAVPHFSWHLPRHVCLCAARTAALTHVIFALCLP